MTNTADLRAAAELATPGPWGVDPVNEYLIGPDRSFLHWDQDGLGAIWENRADAAYIALASPDRILGICEELERKTAALEANARQCDFADEYIDPTLCPGFGFASGMCAACQARAALEGKPAPSSMTGGVQPEKGRQR